VPKYRLALENLALRQQLAVCNRSIKRPKLRRRDRVFWTWLMRLWPQWKSALVIVKPETVIRWHRQGFRLYWRWKSRAGRSGRPRIEEEVRDLIRRMSRDNPTWGAPRIQSELAITDSDFNPHPATLIAIAGVFFYFFWGLNVSNGDVVRIHGTAQNGTFAFGNSPSTFSLLPSGLYEINMYSPSNGVFLANSSVPEPATAGQIGLAAFGFCCRRLHSRWRRKHRTTSDDADVRLIADRS